MFDVFQMVAVLSFYFKSRKKRHYFSLSLQETLTYLWDEFQLATGIKQPEIMEEPVIILPPVSNQLHVSTYLSGQS